ncbi:hypothetical protein GCK72_018906 [Caenorhabditis remanei]|uniref:Uncharacterized protein n=1 Tax=Caenorhabditis remanei TaxID=31234 RepID=A0A6A5GD31_CAERE|nr:hypothetical protein GCK72_018906 [Caenorhabditis remanei]KAF1752352.1 hypothetical protein GCK72_018906 [Caenorhabditis remanei]
MGGISDCHHFLLFRIHIIHITRKLERNCSMNALYIIIGVLVVIVFIIIAICVFGKCCRCRQQDSPDEVIDSPDSSNRNIANNDSDKTDEEPVAPKNSSTPRESSSKKHKNPPISSPAFQKSPPLAFLKQPYYHEPLKEFKNSHRTPRDKKCHDHSRPCRRHIPYYETVYQTEFKKSHRSIREKTNQSNKTAEMSTNGNISPSMKSQCSQKTSKSSKRSARSSKMEKTQRDDRSEKTDITSKSGKSTKTDRSAKTEITDKSSKK